MAVRPTVRRTARSGGTPARRQASPRRPECSRGPRPAPPRRTRTAQPGHRRAPPPHRRGTAPASPPARARPRRPEPAGRSGSPEGGADAPQERAVLGCGVRVLTHAGLELVQQPPLLIGQLAGHEDVDLHQLVAAAAPPQVRDTLAPQDDDVAGLRAGLELDPLRALQRLDLEL